VDHAADGNEAIAAAMRLAPDIGFLDVRVPGPDGLAVARALSGRMHIVFVTAVDDHAMEAFDTGAIDYVVKPIDLARLARTGLRLQARLGIGTPPADINAAFGGARPEQTSGPLRWLQASAGGTIKFIAVRDVLYFQSDNKYTRVVRIVRIGDEAFVRKAQKDLAARLDPRQFWHIHRATLVNVDFIDSVGRDALGAMSLALKGRGERFAVSKAFQHQFRGL
jgi:DNA-binding LytR/AlgR family response regulator